MTTPPAASANTSSTARAPEPAPTRTTVNATLGLVAASYDNVLFSGHYQGLSIGGGVNRGRLGLTVAISEYKLTRNGLSTYGLGDVMMHLHAGLASGEQWSAGGMLMVSLPTGDADRGFGMGHVMFMPEAWASWHRSRLSLDAAVGAGYAAGGAAAHAEHGGGGAWPLVDPMNALEATFDTKATVSLAKALAVGVRLFGAVPIGDGSSRMVLAGRVLWTAERVVTMLEIGGGLVGDPFELRGTLNAMIRVR
ncbi:MAG: hypothetical protein AB7T06_16225 [Kofleriaceae bacterium]